MRRGVGEWTVRVGRRHWLTHGFVTVQHHLTGGLRNLTSPVSMSTTTRSTFRLSGSGWTAAACRNAWNPEPQEHEHDQIISMLAIPTPIMLQTCSNIYVISKAGEAELNGT